MTGARASADGDRVSLALQVLELVARHRSGISANDLARALQVPRSTMYRTVNSLVQSEFLLRHPDLSGFILGVRVLELAQTVSSVVPSPESAILADLRRTTSAAIHLARFDGARIELVDEDVHHPISDVDAFAAHPTHSAIGQVLLAELPAPRARALWGVAEEEIHDLREATALRGYAQQVGMLTPNGACLAIPVHVAGAVVGAVALSAPPTHISTAARHVARLRDAAVGIGAVWSTRT